MAEDSDTAENATQRIRINKIRANGAPEWVCHAWVGCEFEMVHHEKGTFVNYVPVVKFQQLNKEGTALATRDTETTLYLVSQGIALIELRRRSPAAARWYAEAYFPQPAAYFAFEEQEVQLLD
jgi:hypothetical protein